MKVSNINLGKDVVLDPTTSINNIIIGDRVKIAKYCSVYGSEEKLLEIGEDTIIAMFAFINGYDDKVIIGSNISISPRVTIMTGSGPNASPDMVKHFPMKYGPVIIGSHSWIGVNCTIMPGVELGDHCFVLPNSFVNKSFPPYSIISGTPARLIRRFEDD